MRLLHTADLHLGRSFGTQPLDADHAAVLGQIADAVVEHRPDVLIIAGDIYDRAAPPATAVRLFNDFLSRIAHETAAAVVMIAGNHDSGDRLDTLAIMTDPARALVRGIVRAEEPPLLLTDVHGPVAISALPFSYEYAARACFSDETIATPEQVLAAQIAAARRHVQPDARWVVVAHAFVAGAATSDGERPLGRIGGVETVPADLFAGAHYVALGHLHRPQSVGAAHVRYAGAPLGFGFDEAGQTKSMTLVDLDGAGRATLTELPFRPPRPIRVLRGLHRDLLAAAPSTDLIKIVLTDEARVIDAMRRLRAVFPNAEQLVYARDEHTETKSIECQPRSAARPVDLIAAFVAHVRDEPMSHDQRGLVEATLDAIRRAEDAA